MPLTAMVLMTMSGGLRAQNLDGGSLILRWMPTLKLDASSGKPDQAGPDKAPAAPGMSGTNAASASSAINAKASTQAANQGAATPLPLLLDAAQRAAGNRVADAGVDAARAQQQQAWSAAWMPRLDASASRLRRKTSVTTADASGTASSSNSGPQTSTTLSASLPVWRAADRASAQAQASVTEQSEWQARGQRTNTARDVSLAYIGAAEANEQRRLAEAQQDLLQTQLHINDRRLQAGMGTVLDQLETRTRLDQARASVQELIMRATSQRLVMERLSARPVQLPAGFNPATARTPPELPSLEEALAMAAERNPDIRDARAAVEAAKQTSSARDAEFWQPTVDAVATRERVSNSFNGDSLTQRTTDSTVGLQLNWALFSGGVQHGRVKESTALLTQSQARLDDAQGLVQASLRDAYQNLAQAQSIIAAQQDVEATATATFEAVRKAFVAGMRTNIDLLNAQQQIYSARQSVVAARVTALSAQINILALLDQLDAGHIAPITAHFDSEAMAAAASSSPAMSLATPLQQTTR